jgi:magnesium transporter
MGNHRRLRDTRHLHGLETAGRLAVSAVPVASSGDTAAAVRQRLSANSYGAIDLVFVTDPEGQYEGVAELKSLLRAGDDTPLSAIIDRSWPTVTPTTDQEHAAEAASLAGVAVLPVVDEDRRPVGLIPAVTLLGVLAHEHHEDVNRLVGILRDGAGALHALEDPVMARVASRLPWLLIGLVLSSLATGLMASFEHALRVNMAIAFFIPALVYLTDAIGTQTEAIAVRGLSLRQKPLVNILTTEVLTGAVIGLGLGLIAFLGVWAVFGDVRLGFGVGLSLFVAGTLACSIGLGLPFILSRLGLDPAFGSGPVATIIQDVLTILVYFLVMTKLTGIGS